MERVFLLFVVVAFAFAQCPDITVSCGTILTGQTTAGYGNDYVGTWDCTNTNALTTTGPDIVYAITPTDNGEVQITLTNVSLSGLGNLVDVGVFTSCPPPAGTGGYDYNCIFWDQLDVTTGLFPNATPTTSFGVTAGNTYYVIITTQSGSSVDFDIEFQCTATGIEIDTDCDAINDPDQNGIYTTVNGVVTNCIDGSTSNVTICHTVYIQNVGWEWLKYVTITPGSCILSVSNPTPNGSETGQNNTCVSCGGCSRGSWNAVISGTTIDWSFTNCSGGRFCTCAPSWGDGRDLNNNYTCAAYTFCYDAVIDVNCTDPVGFNDVLQLQDDGIAGSGTSAPSTINVGSGLGNCIVLPVRFMFFKAEEQENKVLLSWATATELNSDYFKLLWSTDGENYQPIARLKASGNTNNPHYYYYLHTNPAPGKNYYKIIEVDRLGKEIQGPVTFIRVGELKAQVALRYKGKEAYLYFFQPLSEAATVVIRDMVGRVVYQAPVQEQNFSLAAISLAQGMYTVEVLYKERKWYFRYVR